MKQPYHRAGRARFGFAGDVGKGAEARRKPLKRPAQPRARATVKAIYEALVRILRRDGWDRVTTRNVAAEAGIAVGTLYDYFPNRLALLSGYERHAIDELLGRIEVDVITAAGAWRERLGVLVRLTANPKPADLPYFDRTMLLIENEYAEPKHHRRAYEELLGAWKRAVAACTDLPRRPADHEVEAAFSAALGARRYVVLAEPRHFDRKRWLADIEAMCMWLLAGEVAAN